MPDYSKKVYHDYVFRNCYERLERFNDTNIVFLRGMLKDASEICKDIEKDFLSSINNNVEIEIIGNTVKLVNRLLQFFSSYEIAYGSGFYITFEYLNKVISLYDFDSFIYDRSYINFVDRFIPYAAPEEKPLRPLKPSNCFRIFYKFIDCIVNDINNQNKAWFAIGDYYKNKYISELTNDDIRFTNELAAGTPISFLSYTFLDTAYGFYLFLLFLDNGGFLYFDGILGRPIENGLEIKNVLNVWIRKSSQFLFLRSSNSDGGDVKQWCSWEIGRAFTQCGSYHYVDIIERKKKRNLLLDDFKPFNYVQDGKIH